jgi:hypothetical protein
MPWDVIDDLNAGGRPLVTTALWTEPREALAERENVVVIWDDEPYHGETVIEARDLVGKIWEYRYFAAGCLALKPNTGYGQYPNAWAIECETGDWHWEGPACERLTFGDTEAHIITYENWPSTLLGYWQATNVFTAAGLANPRWTLQPAENSPGDAPPYPHLPKAALWAEFQPVLNQATLVVLRDWCNGSWTYGNASSLYKELGGAEGDGETWAHWRAAAWSSIPESDDTTVGAAGRVGKAGSGDRRGWPYHPNDYWFRVDAFLTFDLAIDLSGLADVKHADETACAPTRLLIYWRHKCAAAAGQGVTKDTCNYEVQISGDGGANWTTLGAYTSSRNDDWKPEKIELAAESYAEYWTADFILRFQALDDKNDDTAIWDDPGTGEVSDYDQTTTIDWLSVMVEFDWEYKA